MTPATFGWWEVTVAKKVIVETDECPAKLECHPVVLEVGGPTQRFIFDDREHVPVEAPPHVAHHAGWNVRVGIDPGLGRQLVDMRPYLRCQCSHAYSSGLSSEGGVRTERRA